MRRAYLKRVKQIGFEGVEIGTRSAGQSEADWKELRAELEGEGLKCAVLRGGGGVTNPRSATSYRRSWETAIRAAAALGSDLVNSAIGGRHARPGDPAPMWGSAPPEQHRHASEHTLLTRIVSADRDQPPSRVEIAIDAQTRSPTTRVASSPLDLIAQNSDQPDLGNLYWNYAVPEESNEACIAALARRAKYWHCKQLQRVYIPELQCSYFLKVPLPDGEIDYRFALSAMAEAGYTGYVAIEGCREGDQLYRDTKSVEYVRSILKELGR